MRIYGMKASFSKRKMGAVWRVQWASNSQGSWLCFHLVLVPSSSWKPCEKRGRNDQNETIKITVIEWRDENLVFIKKSTKPFLFDMQTIGLFCTTVNSWFFNQFFFSASKVIECLQISLPASRIFAPLFFVFMFSISFSYELRERTF